MPCTPRLRLCVRTQCLRSALFTTAVLASAIPVPAAAAQTVLLTFENPSITWNALGQTVPESSRLRDQYLSTYHIRFSSGADFVAIVYLGYNHAVSGFLGIGGTTPRGTLTYEPAYPIRGEFLAPDGVTPLTTDHLAISGDLACTAGDKHLRAFGLNGQVVGEVSAPDCTVGPLHIDRPGIHRFEAWGDSATVAFDNVEFTVPPACGTADFNNDGDVGTDQDIEAFFRCLAGNCCPTCGSVDFNGDGDTGTDQDIEAFFRVLAGGNC